MAQPPVQIETTWGGESGTGSPTLSDAVTVAFLDVVGYSAMMARDETGTHSLWMATLNGVIKPAIAAHGGELVKGTGDGVHVVFEDPGSAVRWARQVQEQTTFAVRGASPELHLSLRISIHWGPVIWESDDVYGDTVNISARLQQYAPPGGIIVSEAVFLQLEGQRDLPVRNLGALSLRNIATPIRAYLLRFSDLALPTITVSRMGSLPSIAVMPFENSGGNPDDAYLAAGIVDDVIISLSGLRELLVVSRAATLVFGSDGADVRAIGRALGVRYVLAGSLRRTARGLVVSAKLLDTQNGETLWVERFVTPLEGIFDIQDELVERVVARIAPTVQRREMRDAMRKRPETWTAYDCTLRALDIIGRLDMDTFPLAREHLERAMAEDENFAMAFAWAARWRSIQIGQGWSDDPARDAAEAARLSKRAIELDPDNALALATFGHLQSFLFRRYEIARRYLARARDASPCSAFAWIVSSATESYLGHGEEAVRMAERGFRLSPQGAEAFFFYNFLCIAHYARGSYAEAVRWAEVSDLEHPIYTSNLRMLCACLAAVGRLDDARDAGERLLRIQPGFSLRRYAKERQPFEPAELGARFLEHLRQAGLPE